MGVVEFSAGRGSQSDWPEKRFEWSEVPRLKERSKSQEEERSEDASSLKYFQTSFTDSSYSKEGTELKSDKEDWIELVEGSGWMVTGAAGYKMDKARRVVYKKEIGEDKKLKRHWNWTSLL